MKKKLLIVVAIALFAATATTLFFYSILPDRLAGGESAAEIEVLVAAHDLARGARLTADDLSVAALPASTTPADALRQGDDVQGRYLAIPAKKGQPILGSYFPSRETGGVSAAIPHGQRAVTLHVEEYAGVTDLVEPGDRVDVLVANQRRSPGGRNITIQMLVENVEVLDAGRGGAAAKNAVPVVTVLVDASDVERVSLADQSGAVRIALRNPADTDVEITAAAAREN